MSKMVKYHRAKYRRRALRLGVKLQRRDRVGCCRHQSSLFLSAGQPSRMVCQPAFN